MRNKFSKLALVALALSLTFSCSSEKNNDEADYQPTYPPASDDPSLVSVIYANIYRMEDDYPPLGGTFVPGGAGLYQPGNVAEFLPVPKEPAKKFTDPDTIKAYYPGSVGTLFNITDNLQKEVNQFLEECNNSCKTKSGEALTAENISKGITIYASVYYGKAAHRDPIVVNCTDPIFKNAEGAGNCYTNKYNFYLAWDLKNNSDKLVKVGSYKAATKFYWQIEYIDATDNLKSKKFDQKEFTDTFEILCWDAENPDDKQVCQSKGGYRPPEGYF